MSPFAKYTLYLLYFQVFIWDLYLKAARTVTRPAIDGVLRVTARSMMAASNPDQFRRRAENVLNTAISVHKDHPELTVAWATAVAAHASYLQHSITNDAISVALDHAAAAYTHDPVKVRNDLTVCWIATKNRTLRREIEVLGHRLQPELTPGPWGMREEGRAFLADEAERMTSIRERLGDLRHRILHPPGPDDITIS